MEEFKLFAISYSKTEGLKLLNQRRVPHAEEWVSANDIETVWKLIKTLSVRGAPMIGVAAGYALALSAQLEKATPQTLIKDAEYLITSRPTAVNLAYCCK